MIGVRAGVGVPLMREGDVLGVLTVVRNEARPFTQKQIELLETFADQAVIAIENTRLLNELRQRTDDLSESLEQQTATSEVLKVISGSPGDLQPVFQAMLQNASRICEAKFGILFLAEGNGFRSVAMYNLPRALAQERRENELLVPVPDDPLDRIATTKQTVHIADARTEAVYAQGFAPFVALVEDGGGRTLLVVPLLRDDDLVGAFAIYRQEVRPFTDKQIELVKNFAAQAVIAIENTRLLSELRVKSLERQTATSEVLSVISSSPGELQPVFNAILENATRICEAQIAEIILAENNVLRTVAGYGDAQRLPDSEMVPLNRSTVMGRSICDQKPVHVADLQNAGDEFASGREFAKRLGHRTILCVPLIREGRALGTISVRRMEVRPFEQKHIALLTTFADQAAIAIENVRLFKAEQQRTRDLSEALEQQTATSEVLKVISSSPGELEPVFNAMLENAVHICDASFGNLLLYEGDVFRHVALYNAPAAWAAEGDRDPFPPRDTARVLYRVAETKRLAHIADMRVENPEEPIAVIAGARTVLIVPMLKERELLGAIAIYRQEVRKFGDKQVELLQNFAAQAVIAIENTRLLNELRETLQQQTATADVLEVISSSPGELAPVFAAMLENATRICEANFGYLQLHENGTFRMAAMHNAPTAFAQAIAQREPSFRPNPLTPLGRVVATKQVVHVPDYNEEPAYKQRDPASVRTFELAGARTVIIVPMLKEEELIGVIHIYRKEVRPFTDKHIALVENFAAQAVIAIENTRLLNELRQSLQQQTATADVLKVISRSTFDLKTVLNTLVESASQLCEADQAAIPRLVGGDFEQVASYGYSPEFQKFLEQHPILPGPGTGTGRAVRERRIIHIPDVLADPEYGYVEGQKIGGYRTVLAVPLMREGIAIGVLAMARAVPRPFTDKQIELVTTFADQAVIAIENVRLFDEIQDKSRQLAEASQHKSQFLASMSHELRTPLNAILGYNELIVDGIYGKPSEKMQAVLKRIESNGRHLLGLINAVLDLSKIEAGQFTLDLADYSLQNVAQTVYNAVEPLALDKKLLFKTEVQSDLPSGHGDERRLTQVLLNLVGNAIKFTDAGEVVIKADASNGTFNLAVRDTGPGISAADQAKLFQEFQQADNSMTRKKEGTGLGLAISKRIIEMHGGRIWVELQIGRGSTFFVMIPVQAQAQSASASH